MTGRPPEIGVARGGFLRVRVADSELQAIDVARGQLSRSDFVRDAVSEAVRRRGGRK